MKLVVCERFLNFQTSKQCGKNKIGSWSGLSGPSHGTTGTMVNPALVIGIM